jgi:hypothetical protein
LLVHCGVVPAGLIAVINSATFSRPPRPSWCILAIKVTEAPIAEAGQRQVRL